MGGVYVSKPPLVVSAPTYPDVPVDWVFGWGWPSIASPPGYAVASERADMLLTSDATVTVGAETAAVSKFIDTTGNGPMGIPNPEFAQTWTAAIGGSPITLKKSGGVFAASIEYGFYAVGLFLGASENIEFDIDESDIGSTIILTATSTDGEDTYTDTASVDVISTDFIRIGLTLTLPPETVFTLSFSDGSELVIDSIGGTINQGSTTGVFATADVLNIFSLEGPSASMGVYYGCSVLIDLTPASLFALNGETCSTDLDFTYEYDDPITDWWASVTCSFNMWTKEEDNTTIDSHSSINQITVVEGVDDQQSVDHCSIDGDMIVDIA